MKFFGAGLVVSGALLLAGCGEGEDAHGHEHGAGGEHVLLGEVALAGVVRAEGALLRYDNPYGDGRPNPFPVGTRARVHAVRTGSGRTVVTLHVFGATPNRAFGSHVHVSPCAENKAGGHYQHEVAPPGQAADPRWANPRNEVWLDLHTDAQGNGSAHAVVNFTFRANGANAVILHDQHTDHGSGKAGAKLGCLDVDF
jgi:Cu-Zn family superoxide dismutase